MGAAESHSTANTGGVSHDTAIKITAKLSTNQEKEEPKPTPNLILAGSKGEGLGRPHSFQVCFLCARCETLK